MAIAASNATAYALGSDGRLYAWGDDAQGEVGNGATSSKDATPTPVPFPSGVTPVAVAAGQAAAYAVGSDGNLYAWGDNYWGELGIGAAAGPDSCSGVPCSTVPVRVVLPAGVSPRSVAAGAGSAYVLGSDATIYAWGDNGAGQVGDGTSGSDPVLAPVPVSLPPGTDPTGVAAGGSTSPPTPSPAVPNRCWFRYRGPSVRSPPRSTVGTRSPPRGSSVRRRRCTSSAHACDR